MVIRRGTRQEPLPPDLCLGPPLPVEDKVLCAAVRRFAGSVAAGDGRFAALQAIVRREPPRLTGRAPGAPMVAAGSGLRVGVSSNSHKAINNLLAASRGSRPTPVSLSAASRSPRLTTAPP